MWLISQYLKNCCTLKHLQRPSNLLVQFCHVAVEGVVVGEGVLNCLYQEQHPTVCVGMQRWKSCTVSDVLDVAHKYIFFLVHLVNTVSTQLDLTVQLHATALLPYGQHAIVQQEIRLREGRGLLSFRLVLTGHAGLSPQIKCSRAPCGQTVICNQDRAPPNHMNTHTVTSLAVPNIILSMQLLSLFAVCSCRVLIPNAPAFSSTSPGGTV